MDKPVGESVLAMDGVEDSVTPDCGARRPEPTAISAVDLSQNPPAGLVGGILFPPKSPRTGISRGGRLLQTHGSFQWHLLTSRWH